MATELDAEVNLDELENCMLASANPPSDDVAHTPPQSLQLNENNNYRHDDDTNVDNNNVNNIEKDMDVHGGRSDRDDKNKHHRHHRERSKHRHSSSHHKHVRGGGADDDDDAQLAGGNTEADAGESRRARKEEKKRRREEKKQQKRKRRRAQHSEGDEDDDNESEADEDDDKKKRPSHSRHREHKQRGSKRRKSSRYVLDAAESVSDDDGFIVDDNEDDEEEAGFDAAAASSEQKRTQPHFIFHEGDDQLTAEELGREYEERVKSMRRQQTLRGQQAARNNGPQARLSSNPSAPRSRLRLGAAPSDASQAAFSSQSQRVAIMNGSNNTNTVLTNSMHQRISSTRFAAHRLPSDSDPKVFAIKCRPRMARLLVARIVNKCYAYRVGRNYEHRRVDLGIISAFCLDHVPEYIYVEAYRKLFVEHAVNGLEGLFRFQITVVEPSELMQMMERRVRTNRLQVGALVRLRRRRYRGDLAEVVAMHSDGHRLTCRAVPREDFVNKAYHKMDTKAAAANSPYASNNDPSVLLPPRFFVPHLARGVVQDREDCLRWGELRFDRAGYILFEVTTRSVYPAVDSTAPTTEELARFYDNNRARVREAIARTTGQADGATSGSANSNNNNNITMNSSMHACTNMCTGDRVRVVSGQLRDTVGTIVNIFTSNQTALLSCVVPQTSHNDSNTRTGTRPSVSEVQVRVELNACVRSFIEGTHVIVDQGEHAGESGTVVQSGHDTVLLFPDRRGVAGATELRVRANDCHQSTLLGNSFGHSHGTWRLFDLVSISEANMVACIVRLARHDVDVLTERNERRTLTYAQIKAIRNRNSGNALGGVGSSSATTHRTVDPWQNVLHRGCEVHIQRTPLTPFHLGGCTGRVEQVHHSTVFVHSRAMSENGGLIALPASCVLLTGGRTSSRRVAPPRELPAPMRRAHNATRADLSVMRRGSQQQQQQHNPDGQSNSGYEDWQAQSEWYEPSVPGMM